MIFVLKGANIISKQTNLGSWNQDKLILDSVKFFLVETKKQRNFFNNIVKTHHSYVNTTTYGGRQINWLIHSNIGYVGAIGLGSAIMALKDRDNFIGWNKETRLRNLVNIANNWRCCLMGNYKNLGTKVLSLLIKHGKIEWKKKYGNELYLIETLIKPPKTGLMYLAGCWSQVGHTKGSQFKWIHKKNWDQYNKEGWTVMQKYQQYGKIKDLDRWNIIKEGGTEKKIILVKPINKHWAKKLQK